MTRLSALLIALLSSAALADRRELFLQAEGALGVQFTHDGATGLQPGTMLGVDVQLHVFYGITNSLHLGGYVRGYYAPDAHFAGVTPTLSDGSTPTGTLYENAFGVGGGGLARWRFDTGFFIAPFVQLEVGFLWHRIEKQQLIPDGRDFGINLPSHDRVAADGRLLAGLEARIGELFVVSLHLGGRLTFEKVPTSEFTAGLACGVVF